MTKADVINEIVEKTGVARRDVAVTVEAFMEVIKNKMVNERENVYLRGFGSFNVKNGTCRTVKLMFFYFYSSLYCYPAFIFRNIIRFKYAYQATVLNIVYTASHYRSANNY